MERHREEMMESEKQTPQPVAYDADGNPLYAAPPSQDPTVAAPPRVQVVHMARSLEPEVVQVTPEVKRRHEESVKAFPELNLSDHEYVVSAVHRHPIGLFGVMFVTGLSVAIVFAMLFNFPFFADTLGISMTNLGMFWLIGILVLILFLIGGYAAIWVYVNNRLFLTNESVIQEIQKSLFSKTEQTVSLMNIEDASYDQHGPLQALLNYGSIRLSTEGEETTYRFNYVSNPKQQIAILNNAVEAFKNGRPVGSPLDDGERPRPKL